MAKEDFVQDNFHYPKDWKDKLTRLAEQRATSRSQLIRDAIHEKYIKGDKNE